MKRSEFKSIIKEAMRELLQEEPGLISEHINRSNTSNTYAPSYVSKAGVLNEIPQEAINREGGPNKNKYHNPINDVLRKVANRMTPADFNDVS